MFYVSARTDQPVQVSLPVAEALNQRLISLPGFIDVERGSLAQITVAMRKVMQHVAELAE